MFAGKPIIASYSGFPSMINEAGCGTFVPAEDKNELLKAIMYYADMSQSERNAIGLNGKKWLLENRSYQKLAAEYIKLIE